jgi:hypothetical protein
MPTAGLFLILLPCWIILRTYRKESYRRQKDKGRRQRAQSCNVAWAQYSFGQEA